MNRSALLTLIGLLILAPARVSPCADAEHNYGKWEKEIAAFEQMDRTNAAPKGGLLFTGSSTIRLWTTLAQDYPGQKVINRGFGGCEIVDCTHFADRIVFPYQPRMIFFRAGGNDLWNGKSPEQVFADYKDFVETVHSKLPETEIVFISWSPTPSRWKQADKEKALNTMVEDYTRQTPRLKYVETYDMVLGADGKPREELFREDKLHFNSEGYKLLAERVRPFLTQ
jgi:GDSL-like Lipase/Acylhydrolase family